MYYAPAAPGAPGQAKPSDILMAEAHGEGLYGEGAYGEGPLPSRAEQGSGLDHDPATSGGVAELEGCDARLVQVALLLADEDQRSSLAGGAGSTYDVNGVAQGELPSDLPFGGTGDARPVPSSPPASPSPTPPLPHASKGVPHHVGQADHPEASTRSEAAAECECDRPRAPRAPLWDALAPRSPVGAPAIQDRVPIAWLDQALHDGVQPFPTASDCEMRPQVSMSGDELCAGARPCVTAPSASTQKGEDVPTAADGAPGNSMDVTVPTAGTMDTEAAHCVGHLAVDSAETVAAAARHLTLPRAWLEQAKEELKARASLGEAISPSA